MIYLFFIFILAFVFVSLFSYFYNWKDDRPDLGGFGGQK